MILAGTLNIAFSAIDIGGLQQKHMTVLSFEGVAAETTFEF